MRCAFSLHILNALIPVWYTPNHSRLPICKKQTPFQVFFFYMHCFLSISLINDFQLLITKQQAPFQGIGLGSSSSAGHFPPGVAYQSMKYGAGSSSPWDSSQRNRFAPDKGGRRDRERDSINYVDSFGISSDRNRGPRASKPKNRNSAEESSSSAIHKDVESTSGVQLDQYNNPEFVTDYENAKFFVIKSFSEDNIHKSIKYGIWASTPLGNRKLDAAFQEAKGITGNCPVFLFFSVCCISI